MEWRQCKLIEESEELTKHLYLFSVIVYYSFPKKNLEFKSNETKQISIL